MITLFYFRIVYLCKIKMINIGVRGINCEVAVKLIYVSRKVSVFIDLLLVGVLLEY
jgi:hypothetical protein